MSVDEGTRSGNDAATMLADEHTRLDDEATAWQDDAGALCDAII
jgi:hypothetical protein